MSVIPCKQSEELREHIERYSEVLESEAHTLGNHGLDKADFYEFVFRGALEKLRGRYAATMKPKREFVGQVLDHMRDGGFIKGWESTGGANRHDYSVELNSGRTAVIELKGCLDGNNTTIFKRPPNAQEFIVWSLCTSPGSDPRKGAWSGIHTRLGAEIISEGQHVDGLIIWDMVCGTIARPCPKILQNEKRVSRLGEYVVPPPCIYVMPATIPSPRNNPNPLAQSLEEVQILKAFHDCFGGNDEEVHYVDYEVSNRNNDTVRITKVKKAGEVLKKSKETPIRRA